MSLPPITQTIDSRTLPAAHLDRLKASIAAWGGASEARSNLGGEIALVLIGLVLLASSTYGGIQGFLGRAVGGGLIGLALLALGGSKLRKRFSGPVGTFTLATDAYLVVSDGGTLKVYSLAHFVAHEITEHATNGVYTHTSLTVRFEGGAQVEVGDDLARADRAEAATRSKLFHQILTGAERATSARRTGDWSKLDGADMFPVPGK